jgi:hypothetical protein
MMDTRRSNAPAGCHPLGRHVQLGFAGNRALHLARTTNDKHSTLL